MSRRKQDYPVVFTKQQLSAMPTVRPVFWWLLGGAVVLYLVRTTGSGDVLAPTEQKAKELAESLPEGTFMNALPTVGKQYATVIERAARGSAMSPYLLGAIMEKESYYGEALRPKGPGGTSADGSDRGLMQINKVAHPDFTKWADPYESVKYAAGVINSNLKFFASKPKTPTVTVKAGGYANSRGVPAGVYADPRPLSGDFLLRAAISAYNTGAGNVLQAVAGGRDTDITTTGGDYAAGVLQRMNRLMSAAQKAA